MKLVAPQMLLRISQANQRYRLLVLMPLALRQDLGKVELTQQIQQTLCQLHKTVMLLAQDHLANLRDRKIHSKGQKLPKKQILEAIPQIPDQPHLAMIKAMQEEQELQQTIQAVAPAVAIPMMGQAQEVTIQQFR